MLLRIFFVPGAASVQVVSTRKKSAAAVAAGLIASSVPALAAVKPVLYTVSVVFWLIGFDIIYALQDYEFDRAHGLRSLVVAWGPRNAMKIAFLAHLIMCALLLLFGLMCRFRVAYMVGWIIILGCLTMEHWIAWRRSLNWVQNAFFRLNAVVSMVFFAVTAAEVIFRGGFRTRW